MGNQRMRGWKTWTGGGMLAGATFLQAMGYPEFGTMLGNFGLTFLGVGIAHKIEKVSTARGNPDAVRESGPSLGPAGRRTN